MMYVWLLHVRTYICHVCTHVHTGTCMYVCMINRMYVCHVCVVYYI